MLKTRNSLWLTGAGSLFAAFVYWWAQAVEPFRLELTEPTIDCPRLPREWDGLRVLFLSDPHVETFARRETMLVELLRNLPTQPDVIVWGGDFLFHFGETEAGLSLVRAVQALFPGVPTFGVLGNAEHKIAPKVTAKFVRDLEVEGVRILNNQRETLTLRGISVTIAGVDDPYYGHDDLPAALADAPADRFTLLLAHSPQIFYRAAKMGVDLMLSGHTHGGQVRLPLLGATKSQNPYGRKLDMGLFDAARLRPLVSGRTIPEQFRLFVVRGIGVAPAWRFYWLRPRLLCRPEIALLNLKCAK